MRKDDREIIKEFACNNERMIRLLEEIYIKKDFDLLWNWVIEHLKIYKNLAQDHYSLIQDYSDLTKNHYLIREKLVEHIRLVRKLREKIEKGERE